jgi:2-iminobutanoate/2-iminopropanoate deaminase
MAKKMISTEAAPAAIGPYSQAIRAGDFVFFSGQIPLTPDGQIVTGAIEAQTRQVMNNMAAVLNAAGLGYDDVVKTTIFLTDLGDFAVVNEIYGEFFAGISPARACVEVAGLPKGVSIEIEWTAYAGD